MNIFGQNSPNIFLSILLLFTAFYIGIALLLFIFQSKFIYYPERNIYMNPDSIGLKYEQIFFKTDDNFKLSGWFIPCEDSKGVILFCHGNAGNISHRLDSIRIFTRLGFSVFIFDFRGYGLSQGRPTEEGTYKDVKAAWNYLIDIKKFRKTQIVVFGRSLGGSIAAWIAHIENPKALIVESSFTSVDDIAVKAFPIFPVRLLSRFNYTTKEYIKNVTCPVLIVHSRTDDLIPFSHGEKLFSLANEPKTFLEITGSHNEGYLISGDKYISGLDAFLKK